MRHRRRVWLLLSFEVQPKAPRFYPVARQPLTPTATPEGDPTREHRNIVCVVPLDLYDLQMLQMLPFHAYSLVGRSLGIEMNDAALRPPPRNRQERAQDND